MSRSTVRAGLLESLPGARGGFRPAAKAWRQTLAAQTIAHIKAEAERNAPAIAGVARRAYGRDRPSALEPVPEVRL
ncbi:hypothetical protein [Actinocrispum sp. NPDC049592]|uniref:hypothetical protein n=1 Tax=Actinocrispum sp. NPDC049592 TaxID=3154835 RepID=UPI00342F4960